MSWNLSEEDVRDALTQAYEAGWYGCLELKEQFVQELLVKLGKKSLEALETPESIVVNVSTGMEGMESSMMASWTISALGDMGDTIQAF